MASRRSVSAASSNALKCTINLFIIYVPYRTPSGRGFGHGFEAVGFGRLFKCLKVYNKPIYNIRPI